MFYRFCSATCVVEHVHMFLWTMWHTANVYFFLHISILAKKIISLFLWVILLACEVGFFILGLFFFCDYKNECRKPLLFLSLCLVYGFLFLTELADFFHRNIPL